MTPMRKIQKIQQEDFFTDKLKKEIDKHNAGLAECDSIEAGIPGRKQDLSRRVHDGDISGKDALAERAAIHADAEAVNIDRRALLREREQLSEQVCKAYKAESEKAKKAEEKRRKELTEKLDKCDFELTPLARAEAITKDTELTTAEKAKRNYLMKSARGLLHPDQIGEFSSDFARYASATFGRTAPPPPTRTEQTGGIF